MDQVDNSTLTQLRMLRETLPPPSEETQEFREQLLAESRKLLLALERTDNVVSRVCFQVWETISCQIAIDLRIFDVIEKTKEACTTAALAKEVNVDPLFLGRLLRCLGSFGALNEVDADTYASTMVSRAFAEPKNKAASEACLHLLTPAWLQAPAFLKQNKYQNPTDPFKTALAQAFGKPEGAPIYELLSSNPHAAALGTYMQSFNEGHKNWMDFYPVEERLGKGARTDRGAVMMVDVGGGAGQQALALKNKFPSLPGRFVVQDLQSLPAEHERVQGIEYQQHDFFNEQPVKGARLYYLRYVPHDWPQSSNIAILSRLRDAMAPGYSRLIVNEWVLPARGASSFMTAQDMSMMSLGGGMERTEAQHREYLEGAGLTVTALYRPGDAISESVIEVERGE